MEGIRGGKLIEGAITNTGNFRLKKKVESVGEAWDVLSSNKSIFVRHRMYPTSFLLGWQIREIDKWVKRGWIWIADRINN